MASFNAVGLIDTRPPSVRKPTGSLQAARHEAKDRRLAARMRDAQAGDRVAYASLLREVVQILTRVVQGRAWFLTPADREDIVQDVLLSLHVARATYDPQRPFLPWLMSIAHNRIVDHGRRHSRRSANELLVDEMSVAAADQGTDVAPTEYRDPDALRQAVKNLPSGQRTAIELLKLREMSLKEAAATTGMSISALKVAVHRAVKSLRLSLDPANSASGVMAQMHQR